jgi:hypothetical protein
MAIPVIPRGRIRVALGRPWRGPCGNGERAAARNVQVRRDIRVRGREELDASVEDAYDDLAPALLHCVRAGRRGVHPHLVPLLVVQRLGAWLRIGPWWFGRSLGLRLLGVDEGVLHAAGRRDHLNLDVLAHGLDLRFGRDFGRELGVARRGGKRANLFEPCGYHSAGRRDDPLDVVRKAIRLVKHDHISLLFGGHVQ